SVIMASSFRRTVVLAIHFRLPTLTAISGFHIAFRFHVPLFILSLPHLLGESHNCTHTA
ncbi:hypothetical protein BT96DRAFT_926531, partial [Gymnopus androsaceus JB14]